MRFVAVGELLVDVVATGAGHAARIGLRPGGSAFNTAVAAAAAGAEATVVGAVGADAAGRLVLDELARRGIAADVAVRDGPTGVFLLADGELRVARGVSPQVELPETIEADVVLVSGYLGLEAAGDVLACARATWVALDAARLERLPAGGNAVVANEEAARRLTGRSPEDAARALGERYRLACVTRGGQGAVAVLDGSLESEATESVPGQALGAGDAFSATLLLALARGVDLAAGLAEGCARGRVVAAGGDVAEG